MRHVSLRFLKPKNMDPLDPCRPFPLWSSMDAMNWVAACFRGSVCWRSGTEMNVSLCFATNTWPGQSCLHSPILVFTSSKGIKTSTSLSFSWWYNETAPEDPSTHRKHSVNISSFPVPLLQGLSLAFAHLHVLAGLASHAGFIHV